MSLIDLAKKIGFLVEKPIVTICSIFEDYATAPLRNAEYKREQQAKDNDVKRAIDLETGKLRVTSELSREERRLESELRIKEQTEIARILNDIEDIKNERKFERAKKISDAMMHYHRELSELNNKSLAMIGELQIDLRRKAHSMVEEKTKRYSVLQREATDHAIIDIENIESKFPNNSAAKEILLRSVEQRLFNIIDNATKFTIELQNDLVMMSKSITDLTKNGQIFIERQMETISLSGQNELNNS